MSIWRLVPELVPEPLWGISAFQVLRGSKAWKVIRKDALDKALNRCESCDADGRGLSCHDKWKYDDKKCVATLIGFEIRCPLCHLATHIGRAMSLGYGREAVEQLCKVNKCTVRDVDDILAAEVPVWKNGAKRNGLALSFPRCSSYIQDFERFR